VVRSTHDVPHATALTDYARRRGRSKSHSSPRLAGTTPEAGRGPRGGAGDMQALDTDARRVRLAAVTRRGRLAGELEKTARDRLSDLNRKPHPDRVGQTTYPEASPQRHARRQKLRRAAHPTGERRPVQTLRPWHRSPPKGAALVRSAVKPTNGGARGTSVRAARNAVEAVSGARARTVAWHSPWTRPCGKPGGMTATHELNAGGVSEDDEDRGARGRAPARPRAQR